MTKPTPEQLQALRIRIAELCGETPSCGESAENHQWGEWKNLAPQFQSLGIGRYCTKCQCLQWQHETHNPFLIYPREDSAKDYTGSLDAIHEAERHLLGETYRGSHEANRYGNWLLILTQGDEIAPNGWRLKTLGGCDIRWIAGAEAWQRAIALDRTLSETPVL